MEPNIKLLTAMLKRTKKMGVSERLQKPWYTDSKRNVLVITDTWIAVMFHEGARKLAKEFGVVPEVNEDFAKRIEDTFSVRKKSVLASWYTTTAGDISAWANKDIEACPRCAGKSPCYPATYKGGDPAAMAEEDASSLHYGWVGATGVDRRLIAEVLRAVGAGHNEKVVMLGFVNTDPDFYCGVKIVGPGWEGYAMGRRDKREAETKFHLDGKFTKVKTKGA